MQTRPRDSNSGIPKNAFAILSVVFLVLNVWVALQSHGNAHGDQRDNGLECANLQLRDKNGTIRAQLGLTEDGTPSLVFLDKEKTVRMAIGLGADGPGIQLLGPDAKTRLFLGVGNDGCAAIQGIGAREVEQFELRIKPDGTVQQLFFDPDNHQKLKLLVRPRGRTEISLLDKHTERLRATVLDDGTVRQGLLDHNGMERIRLDVSPSDVSTLTFVEANGSTRISLLHPADGDVGQQFHSRDGKKRIGTYVNTEGQVRQVYYGPDDNRRMEFLADPRSHTITFYGKQGEQRMALGIDQNDDPWIVKAEKGGKGDIPK